MANGGSGTGSPCGACKFLRRKCAADCIFAPYFSSEQGPARFAAIHKVFGASNVSKLLLHVPVHHRYDAVVTIAYEAQARTNDPVYGCVSHIYALQQQVAVLQAQLMQVKAHLAQNILDPSSTSNNNHRFAEENQYWTNTATMCTSATTSSYNPANPPYNNNDLNCISPQSSICSIESFDPNNHGISTQEMRTGSDDIWSQTIAKKRPLSESNELAELQALAFRMMKN